MRKYFNISNIINLYPLCLWVYMHMCVRGYMGGCMKTRAFIKGWSIYIEMQWLSSVLRKMKDFPQATHGHFHSFYWFPPSPHLPLCPQPIILQELTQQQQKQGLQGASAQVWACVCVCVHLETHVIQVSFLPKWKSLKWRCTLWVCPEHSFWFCKGKRCVFLITTDIHASIISPAALRRILLCGQIYGCSTHFEGENPFIRNPHNQEFCLRVNDLAADFASGSGWSHGFSCWPTESFFVWKWLLCDLCFIH